VDIALEAAVEQALARLIQIGTVEVVQDNPLRYRVRFSGKRLSGLLHHGADRAGGSTTWDPYSEGEQVLCATPFGSENGVVICSLYQALMSQPLTDLNKVHRKFPDGAVIEYDSNTHHLKAELPQGTAKIRAPTRITMDTAELYCTGNIIAAGDVVDSRRSMEADRAIFDGHDHIEQGDGAAVSKPNQKQGD